MARVPLKILHDEPPQGIEQEAFLGVLLTADALTRDLDELFKPSGLSPTQYNVLRILRAAGGEGLPCGQIIGRMITRDPDLTRLLDRMEKRNLITRARGTADRRVVVARISQAGLDLLAGLDTPIVELHRRQLGHMSSEQLRELISLLETAREGKQARSCQE